MMFRTPADKTAIRLSKQVDAQRKPVGNVLLTGRAVDQTDLLMEPADGRVTVGRCPAAQAQLVQACPLIDDDTEAARRNLQIERTLVAAAHAFELGGIIGDQPGKNIQPPRRTLGVRKPADIALQFQRFHQRHDVDAALLQHRAAG
jgi:hypothetical protein